MNKAPVAVRLAVTTDRRAEPGPSFPAKPRRPVWSDREIVAVARFVRAVGDRDHRRLVGREHLPQQRATHEASLRGGVELHQRAVIDSGVDGPLDVRVQGGALRDGRPLGECTRGCH